MTMTADTLYSMLAKKLRGFENCDGPKIYRHFVKGKGKMGNLMTIGRQGAFQYINAHLAIRAGYDAADEIISRLGPENCSRDNPNLEKPEELKAESSKQKISQ